MNNIDSQVDFEKFDKGKVVASIRMLPDQIEQSWEEISELNISKKFSDVNNVVICGMGGSALGGRIVDSLMVDRVKLPIEVFTEYDIPNYVGPKTLVLATSYSGNTEETISATKQAIKREAKIFGLTTGGKLEKLLKENKIDRYIYKPKANPSNQPRMGLGYSIGATLSILSKCDFIHLTEEDIYELVTTLRKFVKEYDIDTSKDENLAKVFSLRLKNKIPVIVASDHLYGVAHAFKNQLNENSKNFSILFDIPELNHHLMEGLKNPAKSREILHFIFFKSNLYRKEVLKRYKITADVLEKNGYPYDYFNPRGKQKISQIFESLVFGSFVSFYLAFLYNEDPSIIPWVDYFKKELSKH